MSVRKNLQVALAICAAVLVVGWGAARLAGWRIDRVENRRVEVLQEEIEARSPVRTPPVLVMEGTVADRDFELVMRGFTNYCLKETWGADRGERTILGEQRSGGFRVVIRTRNFAGQWGRGWQGTHSGGGGAGFDAENTDLLPGRWLWSRTGFVGAKARYEHHRMLQNQQTSLRQVEEEYTRCDAFGDTMVPTRIAWRESSKSYGNDWYIKPGSDVVYRVRSYRFQDEPAEAWFDEQVKKYFPDSARFHVTNRAPPAVTGTNVLAP